MTEHAYDGIDEIRRLQAANSELRAHMGELVEWADIHRISGQNCGMCGRGRCFEEWTLLRDEAERLRGGA